MAPRSRSRCWEGEVGGPHRLPVLLLGSSRFDQELMAQRLQRLVRRAGQGSVRALSEVCLVFGCWGNTSLAPIPPSPCIHALSHEACGCCSRSRGRQGLCSSSFASGFSPCVFLWPSVEVIACPFKLRCPGALTCFCHGWERPSTKVAAPSLAWPPERTHVELPLAQTSVKRSSSAMLQLATNRSTN